MSHARRIICLIATVATTACSNHWRETSSKFTVQDMQTVLTEMDQAQAQGTGPMAEAIALKEDPDVTIFYSEAPGPMGQVSNVLGFFNFKFLGLDDTFGYKNITAARVLFYDAPQTDGSRKSALIIGIKSETDQFKYYAFYSEDGADIADGSYQSRLTGGTGTDIIVKSVDVSGGSLHSVIQLKVYDGTGVYLGKIATLLGFNN